MSQNVFCIGILKLSDELNDQSCIIIVINHDQRYIMVLLRTIKLKQSGI